MIDVNVIKLVVGEWRNEAAVAPTEIDHCTARKMAHVSFQKLVHGGISPDNLHRMAPDFVDNLRISGFHSDTIPIVSFGTEVTIKAKQILNRILMARSNAMARFAGLHECPELSRRREVRSAE